jgi:hypothetical protein
MPAQSTSDIIHVDPDRSDSGANQAVLKKATRTSSEAADPDLPAPKTKGKGKTKAAKQIIRWQDVELDTVDGEVSRMPSR